MGHENICPILMQNGQGKEDLGQFVCSSAEHPRPLLRNSGIASTRPAPPRASAQVPSAAQISWKKRWSSSPIGVIVHELLPKAINLRMKTEVEQLILGFHCGDKNPKRIEDHKIRFGF
jgi:hypothetical protein